MSRWAVPSRHGVLSGRTTSPPRVRRRRVWPRAGRVMSRHRLSSFCHCWGPHCVSACKVHPWNDLLRKIKKTNPGRREMRVETTVLTRDTSRYYVETNRVLELKAMKGNWEEAQGISKQRDSNATEWYDLAGRPLVVWHSRSLLIWGILYFLTVLQ